MINCRLVFSSKLSSVRLPRTLKKGQTTRHTWTMSNKLAGFNGAEDINKDIKISNQFYQITRQSLQPRPALKITRLGGVWSTCQKNNTPYCFIAHPSLTTADDHCSSLKHESLNFKIKWLRVQITSNLKEVFINFFHHVNFFKNPYLSHLARLNLSTKRTPNQIFLFYHNVVLQCFRMFFKVFMREHSSVIICSLLTDKNYTCQYKKLHFANLPNEVLSPKSN